MHAINKILFHKLKKKKQEDEKENLIPFISLSVVRAKAWSTDLLFISISMYVEEREYPQ